MIKEKYDRHSKYIKFIIILFLNIFLYFSNTNKNKQIEIFEEEESTYFTTWATAVYNIEPPLIDLNHNSIRQIVKISSSGKKIRLKFSNLIGEGDLEIKNVTIADLVSESEIDKNTMKILTFNNGEEGTIIEKGKEIYSDTIYYPLKSLSYIAISIYFGSVPNELTGHYLSLTFSYFEKGDKTQKRVFSHHNKVAHWYFISAIEVSSYTPKKTIVCFGDSITDGSSRTFDARNNYPDILSKILHENEETLNYAVVNEGIRRNNITTEGIKRYKHDVLDIKGISHIIVLFGVNDIKGLKVTAEEIISVYKQIIEQAHNKNINVYCGTILPFASFKKGKIWNKNMEKERVKINNWIRETKPQDGGFDAFFDFDELLKDPLNPKNLKNEYDCGDGIHPNLVGYTKMAEYITKDLTLFTKYQ